MGKMLLLMKAQYEKGKWIFCGLVDGKKNKDLFYLIEQDSMIKYIPETGKSLKQIKSGASGMCAKYRILL